MEHLATPVNPTLAPYKVAYLSTIVYDGGPLASYPARHGWTLSKYGNGGVDTIMRNGERPSAVDTASFMQTWLYFGLLSETLGPMWTSGMQQSFLEAGPKGETWLNTQCLQSIVADWAGYVAEVPDGLRWKAKLWMWQKKEARMASAWFRSIRGLDAIEYRDELQKEYERFQEAMTLIRSVMLFCQRWKSKLYHSIKFSR
jgi:hypothetical protein